MHGLLLNDCRNKSSSKDMNVFAVSANMAYGEVNLNIGVGSNWRVRGPGSSNSARAKRARKNFSHAH